MLAECANKIEKPNSLVDWHFIEQLAKRGIRSWIDQLGGRG